MIYTLRADVVGQGSDRRIVYGVDVYRLERSLPCVLTSEAQALRFLALCNEGQPAVEHVEDVLHDFLVSETFSEE